MDRRYRGPAVVGSSKASATTLCQKCLQRGHYSYECKAVAQERPYLSRASRTQQFFNPKLLPKLTSDVPQDLLRKKGVADEQLAKSELTRGQKRGRQSEEPGTPVKRLRSASVSTVSTSISRSPSPPSYPLAEPDRHKLRSMSISDSPRRHFRSLSPSQRPNTERLADAEKKRRRESNSSSESYNSGYRRTSRERESSRSTRRRFQEASPPSRGRQTTDSRSPFRDRQRSSNNRQRKNDSQSELGQTAPATTRLTRDRSLSPFSKRMALTNAMRSGH